MGNKTSGWSFDMINMNNMSNQKVHLTIYDNKGQEYNSQEYQFPRIISLHK